MERLGGRGDSGHVDGKPPLSLLSSTRSQEAASSIGRQAKQMQENEYLRLIEEMCAQVGIDNSAEVTKTRHVMVDGTIVGLGLAPEGGEGVPLLFDLGAMPHDGIERKLLQINAGADMLDGECFAMHPQTGSVVYRSKARVTPHDGGAHLAQGIQQSLERGRGLLQAGMQELVGQEMGRV
jgi:hypothetical protein